MNRAIFRNYMRIAIPLSAFLIGCDLSIGASFVLQDLSFPTDMGDMRYYTRLMTDRSMFGDDPDHEINWEPESLRISTWPAGVATSYAGIWQSLNDLSRNHYYKIDFRAPLPWPIKEVYQPHITGAVIRTKGKGSWRIELKRKDETGETEVARFPFISFDSSSYVEHIVDFTAVNDPVKLLNLVVENGGGLRFDSIVFLVEPPSGIDDIEYAFLASLGQVLRCYDKPTGMVRDHANWPVSGVESFNNVPGLGWTALAVACGADAGFIEINDARTLAKQTIGNLLKTPSHATGWLPHWITFNEAGNVIPHPDPVDAYSTVDTAIAYLSAYASAATLGLEDERTKLLSKIRLIDFNAVTNNAGEIHHGFDQKGILLPGSWVDFGGETLLLIILGEMNNPCVDYSYRHTPSETIVFRGNGFIMELAALLFAKFGADPDTGADAWGVDWYALRNQLFHAQKKTVGTDAFIGGRSSCEIVSLNGKTSYLVEGAFEFKGNWIAPHYAALVSSLDLKAAKAQIQSSRALGLMPILSGPVESVLFGKQWKLNRPHTVQIGLNAWFNTMGYYSALCLDRGVDNAIHKATANDPTLNTAVEGVFTNSGRGCASRKVK